jgi:hypothetical protein
MDQTRMEIGLIRDQAEAMRLDDRFEPRVHAQGAQDPPDVVADGVSCDSEGSRDLRGRPAVGQVLEHLELARREGVPRE